MDQVKSAWPTYFDAEFEVSFQLVQLNVTCVEPEILPTTLRLKVCNDTEEGRERELQIVDSAGTGVAETWQPLANAVAVNECCLCHHHRVIISIR